MSEILIRVPGHPQGKGRARSRIIKQGRRAGSIGHYTPEQTRSYESLIRVYAMQAMGRKQPFDSPVALDMVAIFAVPPSWPAWKRQLALQGEIAPTVKPDMDNIKKAVKDALNGIVWLDDCYVTAGVETKQYGEQAAVVLHIRSTGQHPAQLKTKPCRST